MSNYIDLRKDDEETYSMNDMGCGCCSESVQPSREDLIEYKDYLERQLELAKEALETYGE